MKRNTYTLCFLLALLLCACVEEKFPEGAWLSLEPPVFRTYSLQVNTTSLSFGYNSDLTDTLIVTAENTWWQLDNLPSWLTASETMGSSSATITLTAEENTTDQERSAVLSFHSTESGYSYQTSISVTQSAAPAATDNGDVKTFTVTGNGQTVTFKMIKVQAGTFQMGSDDSDLYDDEKPVHTVTLTNDYYMGETEVTQALWYAVMGQKPTSGGDQWSSSYGLGDNRPAYNVSWDDCQTFIAKLNSLTGGSFRLPTEAEWEYAARGGQKSKGYKYAGSNTIGDVAWYRDISGETTHDVKTKQANELGLYDMSGNVYEWCQDWKGSYSNSAQTNPTGPSSGSSRVIRGGGWDNYAGCRVASRSYSSPTITFSDHGLRLASQ